MKSHRYIAFGLSAILFLLSVSGSLAIPIEPRNHNQPATETCIPKETAGPEGPITIESGDTHYFFRETEEDHCTLWITATGGPVTVTATVYDQQPPCKPFPTAEYMTRYIDLQGSCDSFFDLYVGYSQSEYDSSDYGPDEYGLYLAWYHGDTTNCEGEWIKAYPIPAMVFDTPEGGYAQVTTDRLGLWHSCYYFDVPMPGPSNLLSFSATPGCRRVVLEWTTDWEYYTDYFYIERSTDGETFIQISPFIESRYHGDITEYSYTDYDVTPGVHYRYRLIDFYLNYDFSWGVLDVTLLLLGYASEVTDYKLHQNYPNPFNPSTIIIYDLPDRRPVLLTVYNLMGQKVASLVDEVEDQGRYAATFDANSLPSGIYFYQMQAGTFKDIKKMILTH